MTRKKIIINWKCVGKLSMISNIIIMKNFELIDYLIEHTVIQLIEIETVV